MEASTIPAATAVPIPQRGKLVTGPLLRLRSDDQLVRLFRAGNEEAFRVIHDRFRTRLLAYARQMLGSSRADAEDVLQDVFVRAYAALRANERDVSLRAWLYRIAHNRCIDELRRPAGAAGASPEILDSLPAQDCDPMAAVEQRESLRRLVEDVQRLPEQQRSALLMRELSGMTYQDLSNALDVTVPAVKSLLVRARIGLARASEARDTACAAIRTDLADAHERGVRASGLARRHMSDCTACRAYRRELKALDARLAALVPVIGPVALLAKLLGIGVGSGGVGGATVAGGGAATAATGAGVGAAAAGAGAGVAGLSVSHVAAVVAVAVVGAGGAVEVRNVITPDKQPVVQHAAPAQAATAPAQELLTSTGAASGALLPGVRELPATDASTLRLRIAPPAASTVEPVVPALGIDVDGTGNGGAAAPADPALEPLTPPATPPVEPLPGEGDGAGIGGTGTPPPAATTPEPPPASGTTEPAPIPPPAASTSAPAPPVSPPATAAPPTSAATGGATYVPPRR
ncbi:MAG TPA: RNA polymerase sigma factor [Conexibacter sp.]|nr:RNA polymerase sigma factor [Conexibacter sp.]